MSARRCLEPHRLLARWPFAAALLLGVAASALAEPVPPPPRTDAYGDPLPEGAIARLGTRRLWHAHGAALVYLDQGQTLASISGREPTIRRWDVRSGKLQGEVAFDPKLVPFLMPLAFSHDRKTFASAGTAGAVVLWEIATGKESRRLDTGHMNGVGSVAFGPDGQVLATVGNRENTIHLWDATTGKEIRKLEGHAPAPGAGVTGLAFAGDGKVLVSGGQDGTWRLWDVATGKELRKVTAHSGPVRSLALSADGKMLATTGGKQGDEAVRLWDVETGKVVRELLDNRGRYGMARVMLSPDGRFLAAASQMLGTGITSLCVWETATGKRVVAQHNYPGGIAFAPDSQTLATSGSGGIRFWDLATGTESRPLPGHRDAVLSLAFSADHRLIASGGADDSIALWDAGSGKLIRQWTAHARGVPHLALSPTGKVIASAPYWGNRGDDHAVRLWEVPTGKLLHRLPEQAIGPVAFSPDGTVLATGGGLGGTLYLWDVATGKQLRQTEKVNSLAQALAFAPDGKTYASGHVTGIFVWDVATGKQLAHHAEAQTGYHEFAFSSDLRWAVTHVQKQGYRAWEIGSARKPLRFGGEQTWARLALSPDGKTLASGGADSTLHLWEVLAGKERTQLRVDGEKKLNQTGIGQVISFSPDGRTLAFPTGDNCVLLWDVTGRRTDGPEKALVLSPQELAATWRVLGADDAAAYRALWSLVAASAQSVPFLQQQVKPAAPVDRTRIDRLIADLESDEFTVRQKAVTELEQQDERIAGPPLRKLLAGKPTLETQRRAEQILEKLVAQVPSPEQWPGLRAVEVLEQVGTPEARQMLERLTQGAPEARLTREAQAALQRLSRRATR